MSIRLHATVASTGTRIAGWSWVASARDAETGEIVKADAGYADTMPEAYADAYKALSKIGRQLMDAVHASRATRRQAPRDIHTMEPTA